MSPSDGETPIIEPKPQGEDSADLTHRALRQRIRQQEILAELGVSALQGAAFDTLVADTARLTAEGLRTEFCKVLEHIPSENRFLVRAGVGWGPGVVGVASVGADLASPAGFALRTGKPVISNHLEIEERFRTPEILRRHGIHRAMNVILQGDGRPYGVLEVDSRSEDEFVEQDLAFLQGAANILGMAIERERHERNLKAALERHQFLLREMNHRVKNSLMIVASMLQLQAGEIDDENLTQYLGDASRRVTAIARAHDQLYIGGDIEWMDVGKYIEAVCKDSRYQRRAVRDSHGREARNCNFHRPGNIVGVDGQRIDHERCEVRLSRRDPAEKSGSRSPRPATTNIQFRYGMKAKGLPPGFDFRKAKGLGMRMISAFAQQLNGSLTLRARDPGTEILVVISRLSPPPNSKP